MTQNDDRTSETAAAGGVEDHLAKHGKVSYLEIPAIDVLQSGAFYQKVFGWNIRGDASHLGFDDTPGGMIGAWATGREISAEPGLLPYIYVDRIDQTVETIVANGGQIVRAPYPEGDLSVATFRHVAGNVMGVWQQGPR